MSDDEEIAALVIDNGSGMCKGMSMFVCVQEVLSQAHIVNWPKVDFVIFRQGLIEPVAFSHWYVC